MKKQSKTIVIAVIAIICGVCLYGCYYLIQYANGNTSSQIEAQQRMKEAGEKSINATKEQGQWYKDRLKEYDN